MVSSYSFEWNQELHIVTVEAYNILGSSVNNVNMTLEKQPKRKGKGVNRTFQQSLRERNLLRIQQ